MKQDSVWRTELIDLDEIEGAFSFEEGFSRPDWQVISRVIDQRSPEAQDLGLAWIEAARQWLMRLRSDLGGDYRVIPSSSMSANAVLRRLIRESISLDFIFWIALNVSGHAAKSRGVPGAKIAKQKCSGAVGTACPIRRGAPPCQL